MRAKPFFYWVVLGIAGCNGVIGDHEKSAALAGAAGTQAAGPPAYAMARLTNVQYTNTLHDLFPSLSFADPSLPQEAIVDGFSNASTAQTPDDLLIENYQASAQAVAAAMSANFGAVISCQPTTTDQENTCAQAFIASFGKQAYRRPLASDEAARFFTFYQTQRTNGDDFPTSMTSVVQVFLQSPFFLYRLEYGSGSGDPLIALTSYEVASRLSYFLWNTMPDATLIQAADADTLTDPSVIETQARRLIADPRAHAMVAGFNYQWLRFSLMANMSKDPTLFPSFTEQVAQSLQASTEAFVDQVFWNEGTLAALLTSTDTFINDDIAPIYGVPAPGSETLQMINADPSQRAGIMTQAGLLAAFAHTTEDAPVLRGVLVLDRLLCDAPPPPPPDVNTSVTSASGTDGPRTTRQFFEQTHAVGGCASCHTQIDGIGFGFEHYDAVGAWRTQDNGLPVDSSAQIVGTLDANGNFAGAVDMMQDMAKSDQVAECVSYEWLRYSLGLDQSQIALGAAAPLAAQFEAAGGNFTELLVSVTKSDLFRSLLVSN